MSPIWLSWGEAMDHRDIVFVSGRQHDVQHVEIGRIAETEAPSDLILVVLAQVKERRALPIFSRNTLVGRPVFESRFHRLPAVPLKGPPLIDRMQRIDQRKAAIKPHAGGTGALAEAIDDVHFVDAL